MSGSRIVKSEYFDTVLSPYEEISKLCCVCVTDFEICDNKGFVDMCVESLSFRAAEAADLHRRFKEHLFFETLFTGRNEVLRPAHLS